MHGAAVKQLPACVCQPPQMAINLYRQIAKTSASSTARLRAGCQAVPVSAVYDSHAPEPSEAPAKRWRCANRAELMHRVSSAAFRQGAFEQEVVLLQHPRAELSTLPGLDEILRENWIDHGSRGGHRPSNGQRALCFVDRSFVAAAPAVGRSSAVVDGSAVGAALDRGHTLISHAVQLWSAATAELCLQLSDSLGRTTNANLYCCGADLPAALAAHNDAQCVFVWQLEGSKRWRIWLREAAMLPVDDRRVFGKHRDRQLELHCLGQPDMTLSLHPGDVMYLPRGAIHATDTTGGTQGGSPSVHLTVGVDSWSVADFTTGQQLPALTMPQVVHRVLSRSTSVSSSSQQQWRAIAQHLQDSVVFRRSLPVGGEDKHSEWTQAARDAMKELSLVHDVASMCLNEQEVHDAVQELCEEHTEKLETWRAAMKTLASGGNK
eukprot:COSAG03_NODE_15_length_22165_cov_72.809934_13_plen_435_part_00